MANSPLLIPPSSSEKPTTSKSKLQVPVSNGATPESSSGGNGASGHDLAEQMNEDEKRKYVKGLLSSLILAITANHSI